MLFASKAIIYLRRKGAGRLETISSKQWTVIELARAEEEKYGKVAD